jgi:hypothetical protein
VSPTAFPCPDPARLDDYLQGRLACESMDELLAHVSTCPTCRERAQANGATAPGDGARLLAPPLARGISFGRYLVLDRIGQGGMGVVYAAYDPELNRRIALKVIRTDGNDAPRAPPSLRSARSRDGVQLGTPLGDCRGKRSCGRLGAVRRPRGEAAQRKPLTCYGDERSVADGLRRQAGRV